MSKVTMRRPDARAMAQLLAEQTQTAAGLILRLAWRQGLTREEIQRLTWNDVDFSAHQLRLPDRTIPLETETEDCLRRQAERPDPPTPFVVVSDRRRQQMPPESISRLARKTLDRAGLGGISLMDLRHDFIIRHLESHDWPYVARISGIAVPTLYAVFSDYLPEGRQKDSLPRQEVDGFLMWKLLQAEGSSPVGLALWMGWKLGMQVREMTALTWDQVDLDRGLVRLPDRDLALGVTLRRLLRAAAGRRRPGEDPHVLLTPNSRRPLDQPRLSKMVRTALIRGGMEHISLGDLCREERRENEDARLLAYAAEKGTISRSEAMSLLGLSKVAAYERLRQLAERGKLVRVGGKYYPAGQVVPPEEQYDVIRTFLEQSGPAYRQDLAALLHVGDRQCARSSSTWWRTGAWCRPGSGTPFPFVRRFCCERRKRRAALRGRSLFWPAPRPEQKSRPCYDGVTWLSMRFVRRFSIGLKGLRNAGHRQFFPVNWPCERRKRPASGSAVGVGRHKLVG